MSPSRALLAAGLACVLACVSFAAGCSAGDPALDEYKPKDTQSIIKSVALGASDTTAFDPTRVGTQFPAGTTHVIGRYEWAGADPKDTVKLHWFLDAEQLLEQGEPVGKTDGSEAWFLKSTDGPLPNGSYRVEFRVNDAVVTTIPFRIGTD